MLSGKLALIRVRIQREIDLQQRADMIYSKARDREYARPRKAKGADSGPMGGASKVPRVAEQPELGAASSSVVGGTNDRGGVGADEHGEGEGEDEEDEEDGGRVAILSEVA